MKTIIRNISAIFTAEEEPVLTDPGSSVKTMENTDIIIENSRIRELIGSRPGHFNSGDYNEIDAGGNIVIPGFVDSHTHILYCGRRTREFYMRLAGRTYSEILESGGGILSTVNATRECSPDSLYRSTADRIENAVSNGTTTIEIKTGYGLDLYTEKKMMNTISRIRSDNNLRTVATALPMHAVPDGTTEAEYVSTVLEKVLPEIMNDADFVDIFCDRGAFSVGSAEKLALYVMKHNRELRVHSGEIENIGCARLAAKYRIKSMDHLIHTDPGDRKAMKSGKCNATFLPVTAFSLGEVFPDARHFIAEGIPVSIATDSSPLTMCQNMQFAMYLAVRYGHMTPLESFVASTVNPARSLSLGNTTGTVKAGKSADLIFANAASVEDLPYMWNAGIIRKVMYGGNISYENRYAYES